MKYRYYNLLAGAMVMLLSACQNEDTVVTDSSDVDVVLSFTSTVADMNEETVLSRATNTFFAEGDEITLVVTTDKTGDATPDSCIYKYDKNGIFNGKDAANIFHFKLDNTYIKELKALWPSETVRKEGVVLDQRKNSDYKKADRLEAVASQINVMPTAEPVPLNFKHEQSRFTFRMAGQNANGLNIESLILELQYDDPYDDKDKTNVAGAFWAYCDTTETAELILLPGMEIKGDNPGYPIVGGRYMIGQATVGNATTQYTGGIWLKSTTSVTLDPGKDYLVTLTPEGYDLIATIQIYGFGQSEGFVGVPLQKPTASTISGVNYDITTALQLMTVSRYINGDVNTEDKENWKGKIYRLAAGLKMSATAQKYYEPLPANSCKIQDATGTEIKTIAVEGSTESLNLFVQ